MNTKLAQQEPQSSSEQQPSWGEAGKTRGRANMQLAIDFVRDFPIGTRLDAADFDAWAERHGLLTVPPNYAAKDSDAWKAHLMRRHEQRYRINRGGSHPRLREEGSTPFSLDTITQGIYEVRAPHDAAAHSEIPSKVARFFDTKRKRLAYLMQSADWDVLPPYERILAEAIFDDIDGFRDDVQNNSTRITSKIAKLEGRIRKAIDVGQIKPQNGGIKQLLDASSEESGNTIEEE